MKTDERQPVRGEVYLCAFDPARGSEQGGTRPAVIVERTAFSSVAAKRHVLVAAVTTSPKCSRLPFCVRLEASEEIGLEKSSYLNASHIHAFSKDRLLQRIGKLTPGQMAEMDRALRQMLDL
ncbi:MAG: type II toxin-antitoxin system PemK/MazF family toxin [Deltaproteobacteria bacterium]|nr:type II toxin-antitoxin system PemK/MazF family toxin [Deltaproteobacteria bacterium]